MLQAKIKKLHIWALPLFLILFVFYYALVSNIKIKGADNLVSIIVHARIEKDDTLQFSFCTSDFEFSQKNSKKKIIKGSPDFQNIVFTLPAFIKVKNIKLTFGSNKNKSPISIKELSFSKNNFLYRFNQNNIIKLFPITKGFSRDSITGKYTYFEEKGLINPYMQSRDISAFYESVRFSNYHPPKTIAFIAFLLALLTTVVFYFNKDFLIEKLLNSNFKPVINILKYKIKLNRNILLTAMLIFFVLYLLIFGNIKNGSFSIIQNKSKINEDYNPLISKFYDSVPLIPSNNLIYNGNFEHGLKFWTSDTDTANMSIINTIYGKGLRITVENAFGQIWFLKYNGRPIVYYPGHKYQLKFKYRIVKGDQNPFKVGWFFTEKAKHFIESTNLKFSKQKLSNNWVQAHTDILFSKGYYDLPFFLNSVKSNSIIDFTDIQLIDLYKDENLFPFSDQLENEGNAVNQVFNNMINCCQENDNLLVNGNFENRLLHWFYAYIDSDELDWIRTPYGYGVRVTRNTGKHPGWSLLYIGPKIEYLAKHTYLVEFKYHIVKGTNSIPFKFGWWVKDNGRDYSKTANLPLEITQLKNGWYLAKAKYTFNNSYPNLEIMFSNFEDYSIVEFTDIILTQDIQNKTY